MPEPIHSTLAVLLHADVVGSTRLVQSGELAAHTSMRQAFAELTDAVQSRGGVVHEIRGDALVAEFSRPSDAVVAALAFQQQRQLNAAAALAGAPTPPDLRIGIAMGEVVIADGTITGAGVVLAQRLEQLAPAGGVCVSEAVREAMPRHLPCLVEPLGPQQLKGFDVPVSAHLLAVDTESPLPEGTSPASQRFASRKYRMQIAAAVVVCVAAAIAIIWQYSRESAPADSGLQATLAVTPFADREPGHRDAYLGAGIAEDIATDLTRVQALRVVFYKTGGSAAESPSTPMEIAKARAVRYVVTGTIRHTPERLRISVQLYDAKTDDVVWAERLDGQLDDVFNFQDRITGAVVSAVSDTLGVSIEQPGPRRYTPDSEAYDLYIQGRAQRIPPTPQNLAAAAQLFERAIAKDPGFAGGYAGAAYTNILRYGACSEDCERLAVTAETQARAAVRIDDSFGPAYGSLAEVLFRRGKFEDAIVAAERAVERSPNDALMQATLGRVVGHGGNPQRGLELTKAAQHMSPDSLPMLFYLGSLYRLTGQFDKAIDSLKRHRAQLGGRIVPAPTTQLIAALAQAGRLDEARIELTQLLKVAPRLDVRLVLRSFSFVSPTEETAFVEALLAAGMEMEHKRT